MYASEMFQERLAVPRGDSLMFVAEIYVTLSHMQLALSLLAACSEVEHDSAPVRWLPIFWGLCC